MPTDKVRHYPVSMKIAELQREIEYRKRYYPNAIVEGKMDNHLANTRIEILMDILIDYKQKMYQNQQTLFQ